MSTQTTSPEIAPVKKASAWRARLDQLMALIGLLVIFIVFSIADPQVFPTYSTITRILFSTVVVGVLALGATLVIITGGIDLSVGTGMTLCAVMGATFIVTWHLPIWLGILLTIVFGGLIGLVNGANVAILGLPPFIATLAMMMVAQGLALVISHAAPIYFDTTEHASFMGLSTGNLIPGSNFPNAVLVLLVAAVIAHVLLNKTLLGRYDISIGSNEGHLCRRRLLHRPRRHHDLGPAGLGTARHRLRLRAAGHCSSRDRRHVALGRQGHHRGHHHRRPHHAVPRQRSADALRYQHV